jgi:hypothetical protein
MASPKSEPWWALWVRGYPWLIRASKCSNYALTNLFFGLCRYVWVSEFLVNLPNPTPELQHAPFTPKCWEPGSAPQLLSPSIIFTFGLTIESINELRGALIPRLPHFKSIIVGNNVNDPNDVASIIYISDVLQKTFIPHEYNMEISSHKDHFYYR